MSNVAINTDIPAIKRTIKSIGTKRAALVELVQGIAVAVVYHAHKHGDITLANDLCHAVGAGMKHEALRVYLSEFGPMNPNAAKDTRAESPMVYAKGKRLEGEALDALMVKAAATEWHSFKTEKPAEEFNLSTAFASFMGQLERKVKDGTFVANDEAERNFLNELRGVAAKYPKPVKVQA